MYKNLDDYINLLEREGELVRISAPVDPVLEISEITDRMAKSPGGGKALLFENTGTGFPVLTNMFGSDRRMSLALGAGSLDEVRERIASLFGNMLSPKETIGDKARLVPVLGEASGWLPKKSRGKAPCQQVVLKGAAADLEALPILKCWPWDGGRFVTLPLVNTVDPDSGVRNVGMYRMQVTGPRTTGMHWHIHKTGAKHYEAYKRRGERMPVSVCLGGDPAYTYAATAPMPEGMDEYLLAGFLRRKAVRLVKCITNDIRVPADSDFVIEGYVDPAEEKFPEGPFGDHTGFYSLEDYYPSFHVTAITHRRGAVYPATIVGIPPQEDFYIGKATEKIFLEPIRLALQPEIEDLYMPAPGVAHNLAMVSIRESYPGQAFKVAASMWGAGQMMFNKALIVAPAGTDLRDTAAVARLLRNADLSQDVMLSRGVLDVLDHATATPGVGGKIALDLTASRPDREISIPSSLQLPEWAVSADMSLAAEWGIIVLWCKTGGEIDLKEFARDNMLAEINYIVAVDAAAAGLSPAELLWFAAGNTDPGRDIEVTDGVMYIDARSKTPPREGWPARWPSVVTSSAATIALVDSRWAEYGLGESIPSPSLKYRELLFGEGAEV